MTAYWISKYALTRGVFSVVNDVEEAGDMLIVRVGQRLGCNQFFHGEGREWHRTEAGAKSKAEAMRLVKLVSLEKQIDKLRKVAF